MSEETKICPRCGTEYLPHVDKCVDCQIPLVLKVELESVLEPLEYSPDLVHIRTEEPNWIKAFAEELALEGIPSLVSVESSPEHVATRGSFGQGWRYGIYVRVEDEVQARALDERRWKTLAEEDVPTPDPDDMDLQRCPACGARVDPAADECPSCGLFLAGT